MFSRNTHISIVRREKGSIVYVLRLNFQGLGLMVLGLIFCKKTYGAIGLICVETSGCRVHLQKYPDVVLQPRQGVVYAHTHGCGANDMRRRGGGLGSSTIFKKFNEPYAPS